MSEMEELQKSIDELQEKVDDLITERDKLKNALGEIYDIANKNVSKETRMLTVEKLKTMKQDTIFATGQGRILHPWFNNAKNIDENKETIVNWVAIRGGYWDWAIYHSMDANLEPAPYFDGDTHLKATDEQIARGGAKLIKKEKIKEFVPCDDEAFKMYRY